MEHLDGVTIPLEASGDGRFERRPGRQRIEPEHEEVFGTEPRLPCRVGGEEIIADRPLDARCPRGEPAVDHRISRRRGVGGVQGLAEDDRRREEEQEGHETRDDGKDGVARRRERDSGLEAHRDLLVVAGRRMSSTSSDTRARSQRCHAVSSSRDGGKRRSNRCTARNRPHGTGKGPCGLRPSVDRDRIILFCSGARRRNMTLRLNRPRLGSAMTSFNDTRHLWALGAFLAAVGLVGMVVRRELVPDDFGRTGPYRASALDDIAARPSLFQADATCHACHESVEHERAGTLHEAVRCAHCHGHAVEHVATARRAAEDPSITLPPAAEWDGDFFTKVDLYVTKDRATCLSCHAAVVGMPADFKKIDVALHLEEQGASEPLAKETCFECHGGHDTAP